MKNPPEQRSARAFGPVPSRCLGRSLGINNIPPKVCSYSCVYCQLGRTIALEIERRSFYQPEEIQQDVLERVARARRLGEPIDYLTFVPDGEPTLDSNLGREIELLRPLGIKIAVISNGSLVWREDVREELGKADWVSLKVDAVREEPWRRINRPHPALRLGSILEGMRAFARAYKGKLATETMLVRGLNDGEEDLTEVAGFLAELEPSRAYLAVPTRPPAEGWVEPPDEERINQAYQVLREQLEHVELLIGYEGNAFAFTGNVEEDLLSITAVHPLREEAVRELLAKAGADWQVVRKLIDADRLVELEYRGRKFYMRQVGGRLGL
ncbi:MAG: radical SAM protein [Candidatus Acetothermia bacterium]|jgi:wyosine [tRNA(Phe)-imidazoG37] synthetase (radical SAM superfamily)|nr:radical SAM protein [Candidatus Acetothermia bacterium]MDH7505095.1 radical SAM protein [Candidatus Acetothermia bacterium]